MATRCARRTPLNIPVSAQLNYVSLWCFAISRWAGVNLPIQACPEALYRAGDQEARGKEPARAMGI